MLKSYSWMEGEVERLSGALAEACEGVVGSYGDPNAVIRAQYKNSDKTGRAVACRDRKWRRLQNMQEKCQRFERAMQMITDDHGLLVMDLLLEGKTVFIAAAVMEVSRQRSHRVKASLVRKLAWAMFDHGSNLANEQVAVV